MLSIRTVAVSNEGSVSGKGFFSNLNFTLVGTAADAIKVMEPPSGNVNGYTVVSSFAKPAQGCAVDGNVYVLVSTS